MAAGDLGGEFGGGEQAWIAGGGHGGWPRKRCRRQDTPARDRPPSFQSRRGNSGRVSSLPGPRDSPLLGTANERSCSLPTRKSGGDGSRLGVRRSIDKANRLSAN